MAYDGLGQRLSMIGFADGQSLTTQYVLDGSRVLSAKTGSGIEQVLFHDIPFKDQYGRKPSILNGKYYQLFFILSQAQEQNLYGGKTCVRNTP